MGAKYQEFNNLPVLVIDDMKSARTVLRAMLSDLGLTKVIEANDGLEALSVLKSTQTQLILCDFIMDGMNGVEFLEELKRSNLEAIPPVIFVSALGDVASVETAMKLGAIDYLVKPVSFGKFRRKIENSLGLRSLNEAIC